MWNSYCIVICLWWLLHLYMFTLYWSTHWIVIIFSMLRYFVLKKSGKSFNFILLQYILYWLKKSNDGFRSKNMLFRVQGIQYSSSKCVICNNWRKFILTFVFICLEVLNFNFSLYYLHSLLIIIIPILNLIYNENIFCVCSGRI